MRKFIQNKLKDQKGLTLIELLAVIVILAIIAAIAIPAIGNIIQNSRNGAVKADFQNAISAVNIYVADNGAVPDSAIPAEMTDFWTNYVEDSGTLTESTIVFDRNATNDITIAGDAVSNDKDYKVSTMTTSQLGGIANKDFTSGDGATPVAITP